MRKRELFILVVLPQLYAGNNIDEDERVVYFDDVAPTMCRR